MEISGFSGQLKYIESCPNQPVPGKALCKLHCTEAIQNHIPTNLKEYLSFINESEGTVYMCDIIYVHIVIGSNDSILEISTDDCELLKHTCTHNQVYSLKTWYTQPNLYGQSYFIRPPISRIQMVVQWNPFTLDTITVSVLISGVSLFQGLILYTFVCICGKTKCPDLRGVWI